MNNQSSLCDQTKMNRSEINLIKDERKGEYGKWDVDADLP